MSDRPRVVVGISGASGAALGVRVVELLAESGQCDVHLVVTRNAERTLTHEIGPNALSAIAALATRHHPSEDIGASIASGSFRTSGMIVVPCSIRTLSAIANSAADNLLVRAADVHLKERRKLLLLVRETPLHLGHLRAMTTATEIGAIIAPPVPAFYHQPNSMSEMIDHIARRAIDLLNLDLRIPLHEWEG
ncbi:UbiX family flavin prenyltransferase [Bradyrhizobium sp. G127]|jgi:4-hydroxy-3-polyprenylbenzoate decarboxylase|uniref:UbiX family flavin prenyltransferase n=1 Tax=Bradyrhizobium sp. G127 TaxID=2904800 RepID=UPI001F407A90|nr:UbiX family flavin prenyltransferase [Bradyrhizobium sp. G127]MCF2524688.1 UbiX family flavin prenyltransferase [Bradyrhizobium sp. G127]